MTFVNWVILVLYILIPSAICFGIIFGIWKLIAFIVWKFQQFVKKNDGLDYVEHQGGGKRRNGSRQRPRTQSASYQGDDDGIPIGSKTTRFSGQIDPKTGKIINGHYSEQETSMDSEDIRKLSEKLKRQNR